MSTLFSSNGNAHVVQRFSFPGKHILQRPIKPSALSSLGFIHQLLVVLLFFCSSFIIPLLLASFFPLFLGQERRNQKLGVMGKQKNRPLIKHFFRLHLSLLISPRCFLPPPFPSFFISDLSIKREEAALVPFSPFFSRRYSN